MDEQFLKTLKAAESGDPRSQADVGAAYLAGRGVERDAIEGVKWTRRAATNGVPEALNNLGVLHKNGIGVDKDPVAAFGFFEAAARKGIVGAKFEVATMLRDGIGVGKDDALAFFWFQQAAEAGDQDAQHQVGLYFLYGGPACKRDVGRALFWLGKIKDKMSLPHVHRIGDFLRDGDGTAQDNAKAAEWYLWAAEHGYVPSQVQMAKMYAKGLGVPQSNELADKWREAVLDMENFDY